MNATEMIQELATGLRDVIRDVPDSYFRENPEEAFEDLASRLIIRLQKTLAVVPAADHIELDQCTGAQRILDIFTTWLRAHPECAYETRMGADGKFEVVVREVANGSLRVAAFFQGGSVQDVYAQTSQTVLFNGGSIR